MMEILRAILFLPDGASSVADGVDMLHAVVITSTMAVATFVFAAAAWFVVRYRRRRAGQVTGRLVASVRNEIVLVVGVLGVFLLFWVVGFRQYVAMRRPPEGAMVVYVEAKQWMWTFTYEDGTSSNDVLTVPVGQPVELVMSSRDVIHSFYVPAFRVKQDVLPGTWVSTWFTATKPGRMPIWCAEYCGTDHSLMRGEVVAVPPEEYAARTTASAADLVETGKRVATRRACVACHTLDGQRHVGPTWRGLYGSTRVLADGRTVVADDAYLTRSMMEPLADVVAGYSVTMPTYRGQLSVAETGALLALIKSLRDPAAGAGPGVELPPLAGGDR